MAKNTLKVDDEFEEVSTHTVDGRQRVTLGDLVKDIRRVRVYRNARGELLLQPVMEIPAAEVWLFQNPEALTTVKKGLGDAAKGRVSRLNPDKL